MSETQRNFFILLCIAVLGVLFTSVFSAGYGAMSGLLNIAFAVMIAAFVVVMYRRHSSTIAALPTVPRLVFQISGILFAATSVLGSIPPVFPILRISMPFPIGFTSYPGGSLIFWVLLIGSAFAMWWAWQQRSGW